MASLAESSRWLTGIDGPDAERFRDLVAATARGIVHGAADHLASAGMVLPPGCAAAVGDELDRLVTRSPRSPHALRPEAVDLYDAVVDGCLKAAKSIRKHPLKFDRFPSAAAAQGFIAVTIANTYIDTLRRRRLAPKGERERTDHGEAVAATEELVDALSRMPRRDVQLLTDWAETRDLTAVAARLERRGVTVGEDQLFYEIVLVYRTWAEAAVRIVIARTGDDPVDPCTDPAAARARLRAAILASSRLPEDVRAGDWSAEENAELIASRAACPLGEKPETFKSIAPRVGRGEEAAQVQFRRLRAQYDWVVAITTNQPRS